MSSPLVAQFDDQSPEPVRNAILEQLARVRPTDKNLPVKKLCKIREQWEGGIRQLRPSGEEGVGAR